MSSYMLTDLLPENPTFVIMSDTNGKGGLLLLPCYIRRHSIWVEAPTRPSSCAFLILPA